MELPSRQRSGAQNFKVACRFLEMLCTPLLRYRISLSITNDICNKIYIPKHNIMTIYWGGVEECKFPLILSRSTR
jgi:hypothetical protein